MLTFFKIIFINIVWMCGLELTVKPCKVKSCFSYSFLTQAKQNLFILSLYKQTASIL